MIVVASFYFALFSLASGQLPCSSQLRLLYPQFFTHCDCHYSEWSEWVVDTTSAMDVPTSQCPSGQALNETRTQAAVGQGCSDRTETRKICVPDQEDRLIMALGLGSSGQNTRSFRGEVIVIIQGQSAVSLIEQGTYTYPLSDRSRGSALGPITRRRRTPTCGRSEQVCHDATEPRDKRSLQEEVKSPEHVYPSTPVIKPLENDPLPFEWGEHGRRFQRQVFHDNRNCHPDGTQHILFMLDTSGSIGSYHFNTMTSKLSELVMLLCKPVKVAAMTFNHEYRVEFCFGCFDNTCAGRKQVYNAMRNIEYRDGWTHTGGAARCACDVLLSESCGVDPSANCIDVVFVTDGNSNDPTYDVCNEIKCLHDRFGVSTYAIGIGSMRQSELDCITDPETTDSLSTFNYDTFSQFEQSLTKIIDLLFSQNRNASVVYTCADPREAIAMGTESACPQT